ncbi:MAG: twin-arginine translocation signal domain-containing protein [Ochrobactrum anthropi]|uniref:Twin-arginine translocation signal domain-containing protein n=1 Tax=Brucella anthropi TaxID=529 RepID=A0A8I0N1S5_BRUAN|nr:twin-arginine translocation signal domain-containing protein [Brucella anthropi]MBE0559922.1 twin-arginine translocation signal domain-containing protein [Brucella anthropi]
MLNRRSFLKSAPTAGVALAVPAVAAAKASMTPEERIDAAVAEIVLALRERYPNCPIRIDDVDNSDQGMINIITHCLNDQPGTIHFRRRKLSTGKTTIQWSERKSI